MSSNQSRSSRAVFAPRTIYDTKKPGPFLKWAGGKSQLLSTFDTYLPAGFDRYLEPFVGGGAMFFHLFGEHGVKRAVLSDLNDELINCYATIRDDVEGLIKVLKKHKNEQEYFYQLRATKTDRLSATERAARLIYLNKTCFNGLYRVNRSGQFNVPFGSYKNPKTCDEPNLYAVSSALKHVKLECHHFQKTLKNARAGDFVYLDPPYQPISATSNFTSYTSHCFGESEQIALADAAKELHKRGCFFMLSNSDNSFIRDLYKDFRIETVYATRAINCRGDKRGKISEVVVLNY